MAQLITAEPQENGAMAGETAGARPWPPFRTGTYPLRMRLRSRLIPIDRCLLGDVNGIPAAKYAALVDQPLRPSTSISDWPHVRLLKQYRTIGRHVLDPEVFEQTEYYRSASTSLDITGNYFEARLPEQLRDVARRFLDRFDRIADAAVGQSWGQRLCDIPPFPVRVRWIPFSDRFQVIDGHHRLSTCYVLGIDKCLARIDREPTLTPLGARLLDVLWMKGNPRLYQPIDSPELAHWTPVRKCTDRFEKMRRFLQAQGLMPPGAETYLDIGSSYGWFVAEMQKLGFETRGVERDPNAMGIGLLVYGLNRGQIFRSDIVRFLREHESDYDVASCFSVAHHFAIGRGGVSAEELIGLVARRTKRVLFFDTGQGHEEWFRHRLPNWDPDFIEAWLRQHTHFSDVVRLGVDEDSRPPNQANYSRMLFACIR